MVDGTTGPIIDPVPVTEVEPLLRTEGPDRMLNEPGKVDRKRRVEAARIDLPGCLAKLPGRFIPDPDYLLLYRLLKESRAARLLWHADRIGSVLLQLLDWVDPALRHRRFVEFVRTPKALAPIDYLVASVMAFCPEVDRTDIVGSLASVSTARSLEAWFTRWLERAPFPSPPWPGTASLQPITSSAELIAASRSFQNCLTDRLGFVIAGYGYFYVWRESPPAVAELVRDPFAGWLVGSISGVANKTVSASLVSQIKASFAEAGFGARPDFLNCPRHVNPSCWACFPYPAPN
jgi:hypothetical protein